MYKSIPLSQLWPHFFILKMLLAIILLNTNLGTVIVNAEFMENQEPMYGKREAYFDAELMESQTPKWTPFPPAWGKRNKQTTRPFNSNWLQLSPQPWGKREANFNADLMEKQEPTYGKREAYFDAELMESQTPKWKPFPPAWGKRNKQTTRPFNSNWLQLSPQPWGKREANFNADLMENQDPIHEKNEADDNIFNEKRGWKDLSVAWGKRRNAEGSAAWDKRETNWNNLKGMWGKRNPNWNKLHGMWGKRAAYIPEEN